MPGGGYSPRTVTNSTFATNIAQTYSGGAIHMSGGGYSPRTVTNSTFATNSANSSGGAIHAPGGGSTTSSFMSSTFFDNSSYKFSAIFGSNKTIRFSTFVQNRTTKSGADFSESAAVGGFGKSVSDSIFFENIDSYENEADLGASLIGSSDETYPDSISHVLLSSATSYQLSNNESSYSSNLVFGDPLLAPLSDNGGPVPTMLPKPSSPVVDAGDPSFKQPSEGQDLEFDKRGAKRVVGRAVDLGPVEVQVAAYVPIFSAPTPFQGPVVTSIDSANELMPGQTVNINGSNLDQVTKVLMDNEPSETISISFGKIEFSIPADLDPGEYELSFESPAGLISYSEPLVISGVLSSEIESNPWTTKISDNQVKMYFKNPQGQGKVQFFVNGQEIAWIRAEDSSDPKLRTITEGPMAGTSYLVRTVDLQPGKNALEIYQDGERIWRAAYTRQ